MHKKPIRIALLDRRQTGDDKPDANPFDETPRTEAEAILADGAQRAAMKLMARLQTTRPAITLQELVECDWARVHFEEELPPIEGQNLGIFFFSIDGKRAGASGAKFEQRLLGDSVIVVSSTSRAEASKVAQAGLLDTIAAANQYAFAQEMGIDLTLENPGISVDTELRPKR